MEVVHGIKYSTLVIFLRHCGVVVLSLARG